MPPALYAGREAFYPGGVWWVETGEALSGETALPEGCRVYPAGHRTPLLPQLRLAGAIPHPGPTAGVIARPGLPAGLFLRDEEGSWSFLAGSDAHGVIETPVGKEGTLALLLDEAPPRVGPWTSQGRVLADGAVLRPGTGAARPGFTPPRWPAVTLAVADGGSGLPEEGPEVLVDGRPWPARYEPEDDRIHMEWWLDPGPGEHRVEVEARDRLGNRATTSIRLVLRP
jgi:hypothetical protein